MANVQFYRGSFQRFQDVPFNDGGIYFVEDERAIYMDHGQTRYRFGCIKVATTEALAHTIAEEGQVAYAEDTNILAYYNGTDWVQINAPTDISGVSGDISALTTRIQVLEDDLINGPVDQIEGGRKPSVIDALGTMSEILGGQADAKDATTAITTLEGTTIYYPRVATTSTDGLMSKEDKATLDNIAQSITGLDGAMHFRGVATVAITDGATANPAITGYDFANAVAGDVILGSDGKAEYVWTGSDWEEFGSLDANLDLAGLDAHNDARYKALQTPVTATPAASGNATTFVTGITQDAQGVITYTTSNVDLSSASMVWTDF